MWMKRTQRSPQTSGWYFFCPIKSLWNFWHNDPGWNIKFKLKSRQFKINWLRSFQDDIFVTEHDNPHQSRLFKFGGKIWVPAYTPLTGSLCSPCPSGRWRPRPRASAGGPGSAWRPQACKTLSIGRIRQNSKRSGAGKSLIRLRQG